MKRYLIVLLICLPFVGMAQELPKKVKQNVVHLEDWDSFMIDVYEVTVGDWLAFMWSLSESGMNAEEILYFMPAEEKTPEKLRDLYSMFREMIISGEEGNFWQSSANSYQSFPLTDTYGQLESELGLPVTGVDLNQVDRYLLWREELMLEDKRVIKSGLSVTARLMTPEEWDDLAALAGPRNWDTIDPELDSLSESGCFLMNIRYETPCEGTLIAIDLYGEGIFKTGLYWPDYYEIYDIYGNVAEMTSEPGIAKGASYFHWLSEGLPGKYIEYSGSEPWLGFRVLFEFSMD